MDFLYRMPLADFDIQDSNEIIHHWDWIKQAIRLSSASLYLEIKDQAYDSLSSYTQTKIHKYLLRGRYRATPFGLWAGVGMGSWNENSFFDKRLSYQPIPRNPDYSPAPPDHQTRYKIAPGLISYSNQVHYWSYCPEEEGWRLSFLDRNVLVDRICQYLHTHPWISWAIFCSFFENQKEKWLKKYWKLLLESGMLIPEDFPNSSNALFVESWDIKIQSRIQVSSSVQAQMEQLSKEIGNLFIPVESELLTKIREWFVYYFDDRFVSLEVLSKHPTLHQIFQDHPRAKDSPKSASLDFLPGYWKNVEMVDLSEWVEEKALEVQHFQIAFKLIQDQEVFVENMVCNRPFAYSGRFSKDAEIYSFLEKQVEQDSESMKYADVLLMESSKANTLMDHRNVFAHTIYPFGLNRKPGFLDIQDLLLGVREGRLVLFSQKLQSPITPCIQHPLNPDQISHPISRIIYEIGNQNQLKFIPYYDPRLVNQAYVPRLTWKGITLQGRRWIVESSPGNTQKDLFKQLTQLEVPCPILAGHLDRELLLHWKDPKELGLVWEELQRLGKLTLFECPWYHHSAFQTTSGQLLYPQLIYSKKGKPAPSPAIGFLNRLGSPNPDWIYVRIFSKESGLQPFLTTSLPKILLKLQGTYQFGQWYYLFYTAPSLEIRLRIHCVNREIQENLQMHLHSELISSGWVDRLTFAPYYPEFDKYGEQGISVSETIFCWESQFFLLDNRFLQLRGQPEEVHMKKNWIIQVFTLLIQDKGVLEPCYRYFQEIIKQIPPSSRKEFKKMDPDLQVWEKGMEAMNSYRMFYSELSPMSKEKLVQVLSNHLHMCCNRAFPMETQASEQAVMYGVYRELGRLVYTGEGKVPVFNKRFR